jgi:hypothetical protein
MDAAFVMRSSLWNYGDGAVDATGLEQIALFREVRSPDAAQRVSGAQLIRGPL